MRHGNLQGMALALLLGLPLALTANAHAPLYNLANSQVTPWPQDPKVLLVHTAAGLQRAKQAQDLEALTRENLDLDLAPYLDRPKVTGRAFIELLQHISRRARLRRSTVAILVRGGNVTVIKFRQFLERFQPHVSFLTDALTKHLARGRVLPDTLLLYNTRDEALCQPGRGGKQPCLALPVFSHHKVWDWQDDSTSELDLLVPNFLHAQEHLVWYPEADKAPRALLRAGLHQQMNITCCRYQLSLQAANQGPDSMLDAGIVTSTWERALPFKQVPFVELEAHARWQYLLSCDGNSASARLGKLLAINSVVLKQESPYLEWYYRSLRPGVQYLPFNATNIMKVLQQCAQQSAQQRASIQAAANRFAYSYLGSVSRVAYWAEAIRRYNQLYAPGALDAIISSVPADTGAINLMELLIRQQELMDTQQ